MSTNPTDQDIRNYIKNVLPKLLAGMIPALLVMELVSRRVCFYKEDYNPLLGRHFAAGSVARYATEGVGEIHWLKDGIRRSPYLPAPTNPNILIMGDSFVEGLQVYDEDHFATIAERSLRSKGKQITFLPLGRAGGSLADILTLLPYYRQRYNPAWYVLVLSDADVGADSWRAGQRRFIKEGAAVRLVDDGQDIRQSISDKVIVNLRRTGALACFTSRRIAEFKEWLNKERPLFINRLPEAKTIKEQDHPIEKALELAITATEGRLTIIWTTPRFSPGNGVSSAIDRRAEDYLRGRGISFISMPDQWPQLRMELSPPVGFSNTAPFGGHWNRRGHRLVADLLAAEIENMQGKHGFQ